jgi:Yip1 domain
MMQLDLASLWAEVRRTVETPRIGARRILNLNLPLGTAAQALLVVAILTGLLSALVALIALSAGEDAAGLMALTPVNWVILQAGGMFLGAGAVHIIGRGFGGQGSLPGALALMAWAQFIVLLLQLLQMAALFVLPVLILPLALVAMALTFWLLVNFIAELHGFDSLVKVLLGMIGAGFALIMVASGILAGFMMPVGG